MRILHIEQGQSLSRPLHVCSFHPILRVSLLDQLSCYCIIPCGADSCLLTFSPSQQCCHMIAHAVEAYLISDRALITVCRPVACLNWPLLLIIQISHPISGTLFHEHIFSRLQIKGRT